MVGSSGSIGAGGSARPCGAGAVGAAATGGGSSRGPPSVRKLRKAIVVPVAPSAIRSARVTGSRVASTPCEALAARSAAAVVATPSPRAAETAAWVAR